MGQQQLLLLVVGIVVVGIAVVSGIEVFGRASREAEFDRVSVLGTGVASEVIAWKQKPQALGGGQNASRLAGLTWAKLGYGETTSENWVRIDALNIIYYYPPFGSGSNGVDIRLMSVDPGVGYSLVMYGVTQECIQFRRMHKEPGGRGLWWRGWEFREPTWADAGTIPASCPTSW